MSSRLKRAMEFIIHRLLTFVTHLNPNRWEDKGFKAQLSVYAAFKGFQKVSSQRYSYTISPRVLMVLT
jgi:hypothetical protein